MLKMNRKRKKKQKSPNLLMVSTPVFFLRGAVANLQGGRGALAPRRIPPRVQKSGAAGEKMKKEEEGWERREEEGGANLLALHQAPKNQRSANAVQGRVSKEKQLLPATEVPSVGPLLFHNELRDLTVFFF